MNFRYGIISDRDTSKGLFKIDIDEDGITTDWLPLIVPKTGKDKYMIPLEVGDHVAIMMDEYLETGVILGCIYSEANQPANGGDDITAVEFEDGTRIEYDRANSKLTVSCVGDVEVNCKNATVKADNTVTIDTPDATFTGDVQIDGDLSITGDTTGNGSLTMTGNIETQAGDVKAHGNITLLLHKHTGITPGPGVSGTPTP